MSRMTRTLVIGATGNIGREVVLHLAANDLPVRALTRKSVEAWMPPQVEVVQGDLTSPESLDGCLAGIDAVFLVWTAPLDAFGAALDRIAKHAQRIVFLSAPLKTPHPFFQQPNPSRTQTEQIERMIETSQLDWTFLRPGMLASNSRHWWGRPRRVLPHAHLDWHAVEILHAVRDRVVREDSSQRGSNRNLSGRLRRERRRIRVQEDFIDGRQVTK
jgi:putative NADH-flavin reductase